MTEIGKPNAKSFVKLMKEHPSYGPLMDKPATYKLIGVCTGMHWSLALKREDVELPYITIELIPDGNDGKVPAVRRIDYSCDKWCLLKPKNIGIFGPDKKLSNLCQYADRACQEVNEDCQEFFNYLAQGLGFLIPDVAGEGDSYYFIEVQHGSGWQKCYLDTRSNIMAFEPNIPDGNLSGKHTINSAGLELDYKNIMDKAKSSSIHKSHTQANHICL